MKKKIFIIISAICLIALIIGIMYLVDMKKMKDNKPVVFSTWGYSYAPPETEKTNISKTMQEKNFSKTIDETTIKLSIPNEWKYEEIPVEDESEDSYYKFALKLYKNSPDKYMTLYYYNRLFGVCGTGRTDKEIELDNGEQATVGYYDNNNIWTDISFYKLNTNIAILNNGLEEEEATDAIELIKTIEIINTNS